MDGERHCCEERAHQTWCHWWIRHFQWTDALCNNHCLCLGISYFVFVTIVIIVALTLFTKCFYSTLFTSITWNQLPNNIFNSGHKTHRRILVVTAYRCYITWGEEEEKNPERPQMYSFLSDVKWPLSSSTKILNLAFCILVYGAYCDIRQKAR